MGEGAALGTAIMPGIGTAAGAALGGLASLATQIIPGFGGASEAVLAPVFQAVLGTNDPQIAANELAANPGLVVPLRVQLAQVASTTALGLAAASVADLANARERQVKLNDWTTPLLAGGLFVGFFMMMGLFAFVDLPLANEGAFQLLLGALASAFGGVVQYYFGSSAGSARKDFTQK